MGVNIFMPKNLNSQKDAGERHRRKSRNRHDLSPISDVFPRASVQGSRVRQESAKTSKRRRTTYKKLNRLPIFWRFPQDKL